MNDVSYSSCFEFLPVGQGLCFTGILVGSRSRTQIMYDCGAGSENQFAYAVHKSHFSYILHREKIKFLVLSHLDDDHVNGLNVLRTHGFIIENIILPYMPISERIKLLKKSKIDTAWYAEFITNPERYISENFDANVYVLVNDSNENRPNNDYNTDFVDSDVYFPFERASEDVSFFSSLNEESKADFQNSVSNGRLYNINSLPLIINNFRFYFYNYRYLDLQKLFDAQMHDIFNDQNKLSDALLNPKDVKKLYTKISREHNNHSLCMLIEQSDRSIKSCHSSFSCGIDTNKPISIMLTGDYPLKENEDGSESEYLKDFKNYFKHKLSNVNVLQIPHHGAKSSNSVSAFRLFDFVFGVFSHGINSKYNHPHFKTWHDLHRSGHKAIYVNEEQNFEFKNHTIYER